MEVLTMIGDFYPSSKLGNDKKSVAALTMAWQNCFSEVDAEMVKKAVLYFYSTDKSGFPPQPSHIIDILRRIYAPPMEGDEIRYYLLRAASNGTYNSQYEFDRLPDELKKVVGNPGEISLHAKDTREQADIWVKSMIKEYKTKFDAGLLDGTFEKDRAGLPKMGVKMLKLKSD